MRGLVSSFPNIHGEVRNRCESVHFGRTEQEPVAKVEVSPGFGPSLTLLFLLFLLLLLPLQF